MYAKYMPILKISKNFIFFFLCKIYADFENFKKIYFFFFDRPMMMFVRISLCGAQPRTGPGFSSRTRDGYTSIVAVIFFPEIPP